MSRIRFTEERRLLDDSIVQTGEEKDFGDAENAAFVANGVAEWVERPAGNAEEEDHG